MWIREKLEEKSRGKLLFRGRVISSGRALTVAGEENLREPEIMAPYGFACKLPLDQAVVAAEGLVLGVPMEAPDDLAEGEMVFRNVFGAEIKLCSDGAVIINGQRFERSET